MFTAPFVGKFIDTLAPWMGAFIAITMSLVFQAIQTAAGGVHVAAVIIACFGLDIGAQMLQVSVTSMIYGYVLHICLTQRNLISHTLR